MQWISCLIGMTLLLMAPEASAHKRPSKAAPPSVQRAEAAAALGPSATLAWDYAGTQQTGFQLSRCLSTSVTVDCANVVGLTGPLTPPTIRQYTDSPLVEGKRYCWRARALLADGNTSEYSNLVCYTVPALPIAAPTNLRVMGP